MMSWKKSRDSWEILKQTEITAIQIQFMESDTLNSLGNRWPPPCEVLHNDDDTEQRNSNGWEAREPERREAETNSQKEEWF